MIFLVRYITHVDLDVYQRGGWRCSHYGVRGDDLDCFVASFRCCCNRQNASP